MQVKDRKRITKTATVFMLLAQMAITSAASQNYEAFPTLAISPDGGRVDRMRYVSTNHVGVSSITYDHTTNNGLLWSEQSVVVSNKNISTRNQDYGITKTGRRIMWVGQFNMKGEWTNALCFLSDDGINWTNVAFLSCDTGYSYISPSWGSIVQTSDGVIHAPFYEGITSYSTKCLDVYSANNGQTWANRTIITSTNGDVEPQFVAFGDNLICITRHIGQRNLPTKELYLETNGVFVSKGLISGSTTNTAISTPAQPFLLHSTDGEYLGMLWGSRADGYIRFGYAKLTNALANPGLLYSNSYPIVSCGYGGGYASGVELPNTGDILASYYYSRTNGDINADIRTITFAPLHSVNQNAPIVRSGYTNGILFLSWPTNAGWILQVQTNDLTDGLGTNWVDVPNSSFITNVAFPVSSKNGAIFFRMTLP